MDLDKTRSEHDWDPSPSQWASNVLKDLRDGTVEEFATCISACEVSP